VFNRIAKALACVIVIGVVGVGTALAQAPPAAPQAGAQGPQWKDQAEYDLFKQITSEQAPAKRLPLIDSWKEKYPETAFKNQRLLIYLTTYQGLGQTAKAVDTAKELLTIDPKEVNSLYFLTNYGQIQPSTPDSLATGEKAAQSLLTVDKPAGVDDAQWKKMQGDFAVTAHTSLGFIATQKKQFDQAEQEYRKALEADPGKAASAYALATAILAQRKPERSAEALFYLARAASQTGPGALPAAMQKQVDAFLVKSYTTYHGQDEAGMKELRQLAVANPAPPAGFKIKNVNEIAAEKEEQEAKADPQLALWKKMKDALIADGGDQYWESGLKDSEPPQMHGKIVSIKPDVLRRKCSSIWMETTLPT